MDFHSFNITDNKTFEENARHVPRLAKLRTLELNVDYQPISYYPLSTVPWTKVMFWVYKSLERIRNNERPIITVLSEYDELVRTPSGNFRLPSVVAHNIMVPTRKTVPFNKKNVFLRDNFTCQYSGKVHSYHELTFDHVIPRSKGGKTSWDNIVTCSNEINRLKADKTPKEAGLKLIKKPVKPSIYELRDTSKQLIPHNIPEEWKQFLNY